MSFILLARLAPVRCAVVLLLLISLFASLAPADAQEPDLVALVNQARANAGLAPLVSNTLLVSASQAHSNDMAARDVLSHTGGDGSSVGTRVTRAGYNWNFVGENVLYRHNVSAQDAFNQWWNSQGHRDNMMNPNFCDIGVTRAQSVNTGRIYYTMVLARRSGVSSCPSTQPTPTPTRTPTPVPPTATPTPLPSASLNGIVAMQGRPVTSGSLALQVTVNAVMTSYTPNASSGQFFVNGLPTGSATLWLKHAGSLAVVRTVTLNGGNNSVDFGTLSMGDVNNDNRVSLPDFSLLAASFNRAIGQAGYDTRADLNGDSTVTLQDFSLLAGNFNQIGQ